MTARFVAVPGELAACHSANSPARTCAAFLATGRLSIDGLVPPDEPVASSRPGRVISAGRFHDPALLKALRSQLPGEIRPAMREEFEWYFCRGAHFHTDAHYGDVLFGALSVAGPPRSVVFSRAQLTIAVPAGAWLIFDPFEPHAVLDRDTTSYAADNYADALPSHFVGFELSLTDAVRRRFGIQVALPGSVRLASDVAVNAETGVLCVTPPRR